MRTINRARGKATAAASSEKANVAAGNTPLAARETSETAVAEVGRRAWEQVTRLENAWQATMALNYWYVQTLGDKENVPSGTIVAGMQHLGYLLADELLGIRDDLGVEVQHLRDMAGAK